MSPTRFRIAGLTLETNWPFTTPLAPAPEATPDLTFEVVTAPPPADDWMPVSTDGANGYLTAAHVNGVPVVRVAGLGEAWMPTPDRITFHLIEDRHRHQVEVVFLGALLAEVLAERGVTSLHGSAVADDEIGLAFLGANGAGKSSLAMGLSDLGWQVMSDDMVPVTMTPGSSHVWPTFPQVRLWPADAVRMLGSVEGLDRYHPDYEKLRVPLAPHRYCAEPRRLAAIYLLRRDQTNAQPTFQHLTGTAALIELMRNSSESLMGGTLRRAAWLKRLAVLHAGVPVFAFTYPDDLDAAPRSFRAVVDHAKNLDRPLPRSPA